MPESKNKKEGVFNKGTFFLLMLNGSVFAENPATVLVVPQGGIKGWQIVVGRNERVDNRIWTGNLLGHNQTL